MYHSAFRPRPPLLFFEPTPPEERGKYDLPEKHMLVCDALDRELVKRPNNPASVADDLADVLLAAMSRLKPGAVSDPFGIYEELLKLPTDRIADLWNQYLSFLDH